nr:hypothetical protein [Candidatus Sigynarchaeota archaeon]
MAKKKQILIEYSDKESGKIIKVTKDEKGKRYLEVDFAGGIKSKLEDMVEDSAMKGALKWALKYVPRDYHLDEDIKVSVVKEGLRVEEPNEDFYFVEMPQEDAKKFLDVIDQSTVLLPPEGKKEGKKPSEGKKKK